MDAIKIQENIESFFKTSLKKVSNYEILTGGYMNPLFTFIFSGERYVYRYPGIGSEKFINRHSEKIAHKFAKEIGLDDSLLYIDNTGHKITKFINNARSLDYKNNHDIFSIITMMKTLHSQKKAIGIEFNIENEIYDYWNEVGLVALERFPHLKETKKEIFNILKELDYKHYNKTLCHNDIYSENVLISDKIYLIDWEFAKDTHPALDLATFIVCSPFEMEQVDEIISLYLGDQYDDKKDEFIKYFAISSFYWLLWAIHTENRGESTNGLLENYYKFLNLFLNKTNRK